MSFASNIGSVKAQRALGDVSRALSDSYARLSSGRRINKASDDAAGLAIADGLRTRARLYTQSVRNISDGISAFNIADGALEQQSSIIVRLSELAEQSANGTYSDQQRRSLDIEYRSLISEFGRIGDSTSFNDRSLLLGGHGSHSEFFDLQVGINGQRDARVTAIFGDSGTLSGNIQLNGDIVSVGGAANPDGQVTVDDLVAYNAFIFGSGYTREYIDSISSSQVMRRDIVDDTGTTNEALFVFTDGFAFGNAAVIVYFKSSDGTYSNAGSSAFNYSSSTRRATNGGNVSISIAGLSDAYQLDVSGLRFYNSHAWAGGAFTRTADETAIELTQVDTTTHARRALTILANRLNIINSERGKIGATQSRLLSSMANSQVGGENSLSAESRIRDVDVANESAQLIKSSILQQVATQVLSLVNTQPRTLLALLQ